jgi:hypothetical protein
MNPLANPLFASANSDISAPAFEPSNPLAHSSLIGSDPVSDLLRVASLRADATQPVDNDSLAVPRTDDVPGVCYFPNLLLSKCIVQLVGHLSVQMALRHELEAVHSMIEQLSLRASNIARELASLEQAPVC